MPTSKKHLVFYVGRFNCLISPVVFLISSRRFVSFQRDIIVAVSRDLVTEHRRVNSITRVPVSVQLLMLHTDYFARYQRCSIARDAWMLVDSQELRAYSCHLGWMPAILIE
jgi:hypothetical protein